jgi:hypothetical protein
MYKIVRQDCYGFKWFLNRAGHFVSATNSLWEFPSRANAMYTWAYMVENTEKVGEAFIEGPKGGCYNVVTGKKLRTKS